jgi:hypothetical protein
MIWRMQIMLRMKMTMKLMMKGVFKMGTSRKWQLMLGVNVH